MKAAFKPYDGQEPYLFVSYSHRDSQKVIPILNGLNRTGYAVWYDKGIAGGKKWRDSIAKHVSGCAGFLAFISMASAASRHCETEINYALDNGKHIIPVYLKKNVHLSEGTEMYLKPLQRIDYDGNPDGLVEELKKIPEISSCMHEGYGGGNNSKDDNPSWWDSMRKKAAARRPAA